MRVPASNMAKLKVRVDKEPTRIFGWYPLDPPNETATHRLVSDWKKKLAEMGERGRKVKMQQMGHLDSVADKEGKKLFEVVCGNCGSVQGYVLAFNIKLDGWCDFHYTQWCDGDFWYGCFTPHVSPIDGTLCLQCCCGNDTRDFRANETLPHRKSTMLEEHNSKGRAWGKNESSFFAKEIHGTMNPWRKPNKNYARNYLH